MYKRSAWLFHPQTQRLEPFTYHGGISVERFTITALGRLKEHFNLQYIAPTGEPVFVRSNTESSVEDRAHGL